MLKNFLPYQDLILVKTKHPRLEAAKVIAGMSGSPIFTTFESDSAYSSSAAILNRYQRFVVGLRCATKASSRAALTGSWARSHIGPWPPG